MRKLLLSLFLLSLAGSVFADDSTITITSATDVATRRASLISFIWGTDGFPSTKMPVVVTNVPNPLTGLQNLERVDLLKINDGLAHNGRAFHFIPSRKNGQLVVVHQGHATTFRGTDALTDPEMAAGGGGLRRMINALLWDGYSVIAVYMPLMWEDIDLGNGQTEPGQHFTYDNSNPPRCVTCHDTMFNEPIATGNALKWFLEPTIVSLNYAQSLGVYSDYHMVGLSGGGWTTTIIAAIDPRIRMSFPVAGSMPLYLRYYKSNGDTEQTLASFYAIAGYPDLYVLGSYGSQRKQVQILNRHDNCCFGESTDMHNLGSTAAWGPAVRDYEQRVRIALFNMGAVGSFRLEIDEAPLEHEVSWNAAIGTVLAELNGGRRYIGAVSTSNAFVRGADTYMYQGPSWVRTPFQFVGVPAVLESAVNAIDVFYRDPANQLRHGWYTAGIGWQSEALALPAGVAAFIADPAAVSRTSGTWDVVATANDYKLYQWSYASGTTTVRAVTGTQYVRGPASLVATPTGLDAFYRGDDHTVYDARWNGSSWTTTLAGGGLQDFPGAVVDASGVTRVYVRGTSSGLWEATQPSGTWVWTSISSLVSGAPLISGSPAPVLSGSTVKVYARSTASNLSTFSGPGTWTYTNNGGGITGSPTATPAAPLVRGMSGGLWLYNGSWVGYNGYFD